MPSVGLVVATCTAVFPDTTSKLVTPATAATCGSRDASLGAPSFDDGGGPNTLPITVSTVDGASRSSPQPETRTASSYMSPTEVDSTPNSDGSSITTRSSTR